MLFSILYFLSLSFVRSPARSHTRKKRTNTCSIFSHKNNMFDTSAFQCNCQMDENERQMLNGVCIMRDCGYNKVLCLLYSFQFIFEILFKSFKRQWQPCKMKPNRGNNRWNPGHWKYWTDSIQSDSKRKRVEKKKQNNIRTDWNGSNSSQITFSESLMMQINCNICFTRQYSPMVAHTYTRTDVCISIYN